MMNLRPAAAAALLLTGVFALAGCAASAPTDHSSMPGMDHSASDAPASSASDADVMFAQMMIPHHEQAVEMSDVLLAKEGVDPRVADLAARITAAQGPEIEQLKGWLEDWGAEPAAEGGAHGGHGDGMMTEDDLAALEAASGTEASKLFLEQMIVHHEGAIAMAETQLDDGEDADAVALAQAIVDTQAAEIDEMKEILATL